MIEKTRTWAGFDLKTYQKNGEILEKALAEGMEIYGLENANAYTLEAITDAPMRGFCPLGMAVNSPEEGTRLRQQGLTYPILVLNQPNPEDAAEYVKTLHRSFLAQSAESLAIVRALQGKVMIYGGVLRLHLKVEMSATGEGFHYYDEHDPIDDLIASMSLGGVYCEGIFTELSRNDTPEENEKKIVAFNKLVNKLEDATRKPFAIKHFFLR